MITIALFSTLAMGQNLRFDVFPNNYSPVLQSELVDAERIRDIQAGYPSDWIADGEYISTKLTVSGSIEESAEGTDESFSPSQRAVLEKASLGDQLFIEVDYFVKNVVTNEADKRKLNFELSVVPDTKAVFPGGQMALDEYLNTNIIDRIPVHEEVDLNLVSFTFIIDDKGKTHQIEMQESSPLMMIQSLIINALDSMPLWQPANDKEGKPVPQQFQFRIGYMLGC